MRSSVFPLLRLDAVVFAILVLVSGTNRAAAHELAVVPYAGRDMLVYVPPGLPPPGSRVLVIVLHGGMGNAARIADRSAESGLNMNAVAEKDGFIVAYLNGTPVTRNLGRQFLGWNAGGGCCGQSAANDVGDVVYISGAIDDLATRYGIDRAKVFGMGHSNGAMMTQRLLCETSVLAAGVAISGPLNLDVATCTAARGHRILAIHGADDRNVPVEGGFGSKGLSAVAFRSEQQSSKAFTKSGASYTLQIVPGVDHSLAHIDAAVHASEGISITEKSARFFGIAKR